MSHTIEEKINKIKAGEPVGTHSLYYKGEKRNLDVYEVPTSLLRFNYVNGRIGTEVREFERGSGTNLDQLGPHEINDKIHDWIWKKSERENKETLIDIRDKRQIIPGVITRDGIVVDGNRRFMIARKLNKEGLNRQFLTVILDDTYVDGGDNELQIKKLETELQLGQDEKVKYGAIEKYMKIMDFVDKYIEVKSPKMKYQELVRLMRIKDEKTVREKYRIGKIMLEFLDYVGFPEMFSRLQNTEDLFIQLEKNYRLYTNQKGSASWDFTDDNAEDYKTCGFDLIRWNYNASKDKKGDWEAKKLKNKYFKNSKNKTIFSNQKIWTDFNRTLEKVEDIDVPVLEDIVEKEGISEADAAKKIDRIWADKTSPIFREALGTAESRIRDKENNDQPEKFISDALNKLENLINEDLFEFTGNIEFDESIIKILQDSHGDRRKTILSNINNVRKIAERLKKELD